MKLITACLVLLTILLSTITLADEVICHGPKTSVCISLGSQSLTYSVSDSDIESHLFDPRHAKERREILPRNGRGGGRGGGEDGDNDVFEGIGNGLEREEREDREVRRIKVAHGIVMSGVMLLFFPLGALAMRVLGKWYIHAAFQLLSVAAMIAGLGLGIYLAQEEDELFNNTHTILGVAVIGLFATAQPLLGFLQHCFFRKNQRRGAAGHLHLWLGRILIIAGVVNGGLGLRLSEQDGGARLAYIIIAGVMFVLYIVTVAGFSLRRRASRKVADPKAVSETDVTYADAGPPAAAPVAAEKQQMGTYV